MGHTSETEVLSKEGSLLVTTNLLGEHVDQDARAEHDQRLTMRGIKELGSFLGHGVLGCLEGSHRRLLELLTGGVAGCPESYLRCLLLQNLGDSLLGHVACSLTLLVGGLDRVLLTDALRQHPDEFLD